MLLFVASQPQCARSDTRLQITFKTALPFTYVNPYMAAMRPPPPEMRFGRVQELNQLLQPGGAAILYGGRQLGKSTILSEFERRSHNPHHDCYVWSLTVGDALAADGLPFTLIADNFWRSVGAHLIRSLGVSWLNPRLL